MFGTIVIIAVLVLVVRGAWRFLDTYWFRPKELEKILRKQGLTGNPYRFFFGDARETGKMFKESYSKPIGITDDIAPRVIPFVIKTLKTYGEKSFIWVGPKPLVFIFDLEVMKIVLNKYILYQKPFKESNPIFKRLVGGLLVYEGEQWSQNRKKLNPAFHLDKLKELVSRMQIQGQETMDEWSSMMPKDGSPLVVDVYPYLKIYTGCVVSHTLFSTTPTPLVKRTFTIISELTHISNQAQPFTFPGEKYFLKKYKRANEIENELTATFTAMIEERLKKRKGGERKEEPDLFDLVVDEVEEVDKTNDKNARAAAVYEIIQQCKLFYVAGHETTANLLSWTIVMLSYHKEWQTRAREEVFQVFGDRKNITADDLADLKYITMIVNETLRLFPPAVELTRLVEEDTTLGDLFLPKGSMVMMPVVLVHRDTKIWGPDAMEFKPDRFADGVLKAANGHSAFLPFGWGVRTCIGANLAMMEAKSFMALLLRNFTFELSPKYAHAPLVTLLMQPQYDVPVVMRKL
ncbi:7-deoxyloganic acid hydroxylase [Sesamum angolense]|uniref:7-deoxyloganic acid hydroxylase n=1 Tax=Sesamum angolense TaxID=2727404 RepID=A0AAE2C1R2_9LAMI|nr:7-deoxyloganic acid hydroxylase [Sesamum angolense]